MLAVPSCISLRIRTQDSMAIAGYGVVPATVEGLVLSILQTACSIWQSQWWSTVLSENHNALLEARMQASLGWASLAFWGTILSVGIQPSRPLGQAVLV